MAITFVPFSWRNQILVHKSMNNRNPNLEEVIQRAERGEFREYWLQLYIKDNYQKLGFDSIEGPFQTGPDFNGVYKGRRVVVEAETTPKNFVYHKHNPKGVDILIVLNEDYTNVVLGMDPTEWRKLLPKEIIKKREYCNLI